MYSTPNGSGGELEKFPDALPLPTVAVTAPGDAEGKEVIDAGLKGLDHCLLSPTLFSLETCFRRQPF
jgi:hypothetical protein